MTETIFAFDERNYHDCQSAFRGVDNREYYLGDYSIDGRAGVEVRAERKTVGACSIIRLRSNTRLSFRRAWPHIREDAADVTVLWFVKRGRLCVTHQSGSCVAETDCFLVTKAMTPFFMECRTDPKSMHEVLHVVLPTHQLRQLMHFELPTGFCISARRPEFTIAEHMLMDVFEAAGDLSELAAQLILDSALRVLGEALAEGGACRAGRRNVADGRLEQVLKFIETHVSDPNLSQTAVARACGISSRYLRHLLKTRGFSFSALLWQKRLQLAGDWILQSKPEEISISQIGYRVGFKSAPHFSRMFKRAFKMSPLEYRAAGAQEGARTPPQCFTGKAAGSVITDGASLRA